MTPLQLEEYATKQREENKLLRELLWLRHDADHYTGLYGDDGEMSCGICGIDFKRMPATELQAFWRKEAARKLLLTAAMNQCDGCRAGKPLNERGNHVMSENRPGGYPDLMVCQANRYKEKP